MACLTYEQVLKANTGHRLTDVQSLNDNRNRLSDQTRKMADRLESVGIQAFDAGQVLTEIGDVTGEVAQIMGRYRNLMLLPEVAKRVRSETVRQLSYFIENHQQGRYFRYLVATSGVRVPLEDEGALRARRRELLGRFRRWVYDVRVMFGVHVLCRSDEYTFNDDGAHFHTNVIYYPTKVLPKAEWRRFLDFTHQRLGKVWSRDSGILENPREVVKYICKLSGDGLPDREGQASWGADELDAMGLACLHRETYRQKHFQAVGEYAEFLRDIDGHKVVNLRKPDGSASLKLMKKPKRSKKPKTEHGKGVGAENVIVHRTLPQPSKTGVMEPKTLVLGYTATPDTGCGRDGLRLILSNQKQAREWASFIVHNSTPSVRDSGPSVERMEAIRRHQRERHRQQQAHRQHEWRKQWRKASKRNLERMATQTSSGKQTFKRPAPRVLPSGQGLSLVIASGVGFRP